MGFWGSLASIAGLAAAPFTGGASAALGPILGGVGSALTGAAKGSESDRTAGVNYQLSRDQLGLQGARQDESAYENRGGLELQQKQFAQQQQQQAFQNALRSALGLNFQSMARPSGVPNMSFIGKGASAASQPVFEALAARAQQDLEKGPQFTALPEYKSYALASPEQMPGASTTEKILGILGLGLTGAGALAKGSTAKKPAGTGLMN